MSPRLPRVTCSDLLRALRRDGWEMDRQRGSHIQLRHPSKSGQVTVAYHAGMVVKPKVLMGVLGQAGLSVEEFRRLL